VSAESIQELNDSNMGPKRKLYETAFSTGFDASKKSKTAEIGCDRLALDTELQSFTQIEQSSHVEINGSSSILHDTETLGNTSSRRASLPSNPSTESRTLFESPTRSDEGPYFVFSEARSTLSIPHIGGVLPSLLDSSILGDEERLHTGPSDSGLSLNANLSAQQDIGSLSPLTSPRHLIAEQSVDNRGRNSKSNPDVLEDHRVSQIAPLDDANEPLRLCCNQDDLTTLKIDIADSTRVYPEHDIRKIQRAADFLFTCGLREDAFPLYLLIWKELRKSSVCEFGLETFVQCIRSICTTKHCVIMENLVEEQLKRGSITSGTSSTAEICLLRLAQARIASVIHDKETTVSYLNAAKRLLTVLDDIFYDFAATGTVTGDQAGNFRLVTAAIIEEVTFIIQSSSFRKNGASAPIESVVSQRNSSALALIIRPEKHRHVLNRPSGEKIGHEIEMFLSKWMVLKLGAESKRLEAESLFAVVDSELVLFCHLWLEWELPFWTSSIMMEIQQQFTSVVTNDLLAVVSSLLLHQWDSPRIAKRGWSFDALLQEARIRVLELLTLNSSQIPGPSLLDVIRERHIWMLRRRSHSLAGITPIMKERLRVFVQSSLNLELPDIPNNFSQSEDGNGEAQAIFYSNPTLSQSLHPSESSSFGFFVNCARSVRSFQSQPFSSHSSFKRHLAMARGPNRSILSASDALSESFQSMSIKESVDGVGCFESGDRPLDTVIEVDGDVSERKLENHTSGKQCSQAEHQ
jgi:hypothetical protein